MLAAIGPGTVESGVRAIRVFILSALILKRRRCMTITIREGHIRRESVIRGALRWIHGVHGRGNAGVDRPEPERCGGSVVFELNEAKIRR